MFEIAEANAIGTNGPTSLFTVWALPPHSGECDGQSRFPKARYPRRVFGESASHPVSRMGA